MTFPSKKKTIRAVMAWIVAPALLLGCGKLTDDKCKAELPAPTALVTETIEPHIVETPEPLATPVVVPEADAADASEQVVVTEEPAVPTFDRTKPLYEVYKDGYPVQVSADLQWYIRDICDKYGFPEKIVFGMILNESTFQADAKNSGCYGLAQINKFWIRGARITHFTDDYASRDLCNPYHNILTLMEMWCYARDTYGLDPWNNSDMTKILYWHNTGKHPTGVTHWPYADRCFRYANELVPLQGE